MSMLSTKHFGEAFTELLILFFLESLECLEFTVDILLHLSTCIELQHSIEILSSWLELFGMHVSYASSI